MGFARKFFGNVAGVWDGGCGDCRARWQRKLVPAELRVREFFGQRGGRLNRFNCRIYVDDNKGVVDNLIHKAELLQLSEKKASGGACTIAGAVCREVVREGNSRNKIPDRTRVHLSAGILQPRLGRQTAGFALLQKFAENAIQI